MELWIIKAKGKQDLAGERITGPKGKRIPAIK